MSIDRLLCKLVVCVRRRGEFVIRTWFCKNLIFCKFIFAANALVRRSEMSRPFSWTNRPLALPICIVMCLPKVYLRSRSTPKYVTLFSHEICVLLSLMSSWRCLQNNTALHLLGLILVFHNLNQSYRRARGRCKYTDIILDCLEQAWSTYRAILVSCFWHIFNID